jgi:general secretion pathway protein K
MSRRGSILVAVLMAASLLVVFVGVGVDRLHAARAALRAARETVAADLVAAGTIERLFVRGGGRFDTIEETVVFDFDGASVEAVARDEAARVDLERAPPEVIAALMVAVGVEPARARVLAAAIEARRTTPADTGAGPAGSGADRGPLDHVDRLATIPGFDAALIDKLRPHVTVAAFTAKVAVLVADPVVVAALSGLDPARLAEFLAARRAFRGPFEEFVKRWGIDPDRVTMKGGMATRLFLTVHVGPHRVRRYEIVVAVRREDPEPFRIVSWESDRPLDAGPP